MSRDKPWLKMWTEWLGDAKMDRLSLAEQGAWWRLVSLTHECGHLDEKGKLDGALIVAGTPLSLAEIMKSLKIGEEPDKTVFLSMVEKMKAAGTLHWNSDTLVVTHYEESQRATTDTKADRARRQRERREALKEKEKRKSNITEEEDRGERREPHAQSGNEKSVTLAEFSRCYEKYIGLLNPRDADRMREFNEYYESHEGKIDWIEKAFRKAPANKRRWPYIQAILERYIEEGGPDGRTEQGRGPDSHRRGAGEGFKVIQSGPDEANDGEED